MQLAFTVACKYKNKMNRYVCALFRKQMVFSSYLNGTQNLWQNIYWSEWKVEYHQPFDTIEYHHIRDLIVLSLSKRMALTLISNIKNRAYLLVEQSFRFPWVGSFSFGREKKLNWKLTSPLSDHPFYITFCVCFGHFSVQWFTI